MVRKEKPHEIDKSKDRKRSDLHTPKERKNMRKQSIESDKVGEQIWLKIETYSDGIYCYFDFVIKLTNILLYSLGLNLEGHAWL